MRSPKTIKNPPQMCIDCGTCTKKCEFLTKYDINLLDLSKRPDLAYSCFLCDKCYQVCPKDISGNEIALNLRDLTPKPFRYLNFQKSPYLFANNSPKQSRELVFFGCNFTGYYPKTTRKIIEIFGEAGIDFSIDCCGKPLYEAHRGYFDETKKHLDELFAAKGVETLICACPNCYHFLKDKVSVKIKTLYEKYEELGLAADIEEEAYMFFPCPERNGREIFNTMAHRIKNKKESFRDVNCCGLGGLARGEEPEIAKQYPITVRNKNTPNIYTYCATCAGNFAKNGCKNVKHVASYMLGVNESPNLSYLKNVLGLKFYKRSRK